MRANTHDWRIPHRHGPRGHCRGRPWRLRRRRRVDGHGVDPRSARHDDGIHHGQRRRAWVAYTFWTPTDEPEGVALVHPDGSDDHEILAELPYPALNPDWSPDGTRLAVQIYSQDSIWIANADGSEPEVAARCTAPCAGSPTPPGPRPVKSSSSPAST